MRLIDYYKQLLAYTVYLTSPTTAPAVPYEDARRRYDELYQKADFLRVPGEVPDEQWWEGLFAVCACIDELVLCSGWPERQKWQVDQLQHRFFSTTNAGEEFFEHLDRLAPDATEVREVYDWCLAMGFKGKYFRPEDRMELQEITRMNHNLVRKDESWEDVLQMFPEAYGTEKKGRRKGIWATFLFTAAVSIAPILFSVGLYFFYDRILKNILAGYFR